VGTIRALKPPRPIFLSKEPFIVKCPACSEIFDITKYSGSGADDKAGQMERDYEKHFNANHADEDTSDDAAQNRAKATDG